MAERTLSVTTYVAVLVALVLLTLLTLGISCFDLEGVWHIIAGMTIGVVKASLVVLFFMHVIHSPRVTWMVIAVSLFWLIAVFIILTMSDYVTRLMIPGVYGH